MNAGDSETRKVRRGQLFLFSAIAAVVLGVFAAWLSAGGGDVPALSTGIDAELAGEGTAEAGWVRNSEVRPGRYRSAAQGYRGAEPSSRTGQYRSPGAIAR